jgi:hypothetical protein
MTTTTAPALTFEQLCQLEPRLLELLAPAGRRPLRGWRGVRAWYGRGGIKARLCRLIGWTSGRPPGDPLGGSTAYDTVYQALYHAGPGRITWRASAFG